MYPLGDVDDGNFVWGSPLARRALAARRPPPTVPPAAALSASRTIGGRGTPLLDNKKVSWFLGFLVS